MLVGTTTQEDQKCEAKQVADPVRKMIIVLKKVEASSKQRLVPFKDKGLYPRKGEVISGFEVCALLGGGGYAEKVVVPAGQILPIPSGISLKDSATFPEVACTVWLTVFMTSKLSSAETFLFKLPIVLGRVKLLRFNSFGGSSHGKTPCGLSFVTSGTYTLSSEIKDTPWSSVVPLEEASSVGASLLANIFLHWPTDESRTSLAAFAFFFIHSSISALFRDDSSMCLFISSSRLGFFSLKGGPLSI
ncbi:quinone oxidoreductase PIG3 [Tanacetum coccineum]